jgi:hypothetical protein
MLGPVLLGMSWLRTDQCAGSAYPISPCEKLAMRRPAPFSTPSKPRPHSACLTAERLEDRLPPGDALFGGLLAGWLTNASPWPADRVPWASEVAVTEALSAPPANTNSTASTSAWAFLTEVAPRSDQGLAIPESRAASEAKPAVLADSPGLDKDGVDP